MVVEEEGVVPARAPDFDGKKGYGFIAHHEACNYCFPSSQRKTIKK